MSVLAPSGAHLDEKCLLFLQLLHQDQQLRLPLCGMLRNVSKHQSRALRRQREDSNT